MEFQKLLRLGEKGFSDIIRGSQKRRFEDKSLIDQYISFDFFLKKQRYNFDFLKYQFNLFSKKFLTFPSSLKKITRNVLSRIKKKIVKLGKKITTLESKKSFIQNLIGNLVHSTCIFKPVETQTRIERMILQTGQNNKERSNANHVDLLKMIKAVDYKRGCNISGNRGYFLKGPGLLLNLSLLRYSLDFLSQKNFICLQTPLFMNSELLKKCAQLSDFEEQLYPVGEEDKFLIATSEQPISAFHTNEKLSKKNLPLRYSGFSTCFRKESGSHGKESSGIFRVHQFEKIEQFILSDPKGTHSWSLFEELLSNTKDFYSSLKIPFICVDIPSGSINNTASRKIDLLGWFPSNESFRELVSCSNCTDFQSKRMNTEIFPNLDFLDGKFVHMLNSTLCATTRVICCILENYQTSSGIKVPDVLRSYTGLSFFPFKR